MLIYVLIKKHNTMDNTVKYIVYALGTLDTNSSFGHKCYTYVISESPFGPGVNLGKWEYYDFCRSYYDNLPTYSQIASEKKIKIITDCIDFFNTEHVKFNAQDVQIVDLRYKTFKPLISPEPIKKYIVYSLNIVDTIHLFECMSVGIGYTYVISESPFGPGVNLSECQYYDFCRSYLDNRSTYNQISSEKKISMVTSLDNFFNTKHVKFNAQDVQIVDLREKTLKPLTSPEPAKKYIVYSLNTVDANYLFGCIEYTYVISESPFGPGVNLNKYEYHDFCKSYFDNRSTYSQISSEKKISVVTSCMDFFNTKHVKFNAQDVQIVDLREKTLKPLTSPEPTKTETVKIESKMDSILTVSVNIESILDPTNILSTMGQEEYERRFAQGYSRYYDFLVEKVQNGSVLVQNIKFINIMEKSGTVPDESTIIQRWNPTEKDPSRVKVIDCLIKLDYIFDKKQEC